jgi:hypothetical protein
MKTNCKACGTEIDFMRTKRGKTMPVLAQHTCRTSDEPLPEGRYITRYGDVVSGSQAPLYVDVWRVHFSDCEGWKPKGRNR